MELIDLLIETEPTDLDWCTDPGDLERALVRRMAELEPAGPPLPVQDRLAQAKLASEFGRVTQH
jgi:hypothetical protein